MKRVSRWWCSRWDVATFLTRGVVICGLALLSPHDGTSASDKTLHLSSWDVVTFQFPIGEPVVMAAGDFNRDASDDLFLVTAIKRPRLVFGALGPEFLPSDEHEIRFFILSWRAEEPEEPYLISTLPASNQQVGLDKPLVADLDRDGYQDVVVLLSLGPISAPPALFDLENIKTQLVIFWNEGDGTFVQDRIPVELLPIPAYHVPTLFALGDFNSDDLLDIACLDSRNLRLQVFYNKGNRSFTGPEFVLLGHTDDACIPVAMNLHSARVDETRQGDDIVVSGPCYHAEDNFDHFIRVIFSCGTDCWEASPLLLADVQMQSFQDALWDIAIEDVDGDEHMDILLLGQLGAAEAKPQIPRPAPSLMDIYLLPGDGRGQFGPPRFLGWSEMGRFLFVDSQPEGEWGVTIVVLTENVVWPAIVVHISSDFSQVSSTTLYGRGYVIDGAVINKGTSRELVLLASLDLESEVTLVNVVRGW